MTQISPWVTLISTVVVAVATVVLVCLTSRYVRLTRSMLEEAQKSREPAVTLDFEMPDESIRLVVENHGLSPARNVRITVLKDAPLFQDQQGFADKWPLKDGISYLTRLHKLKYYLGCQNLENTPEEQMITTFRITYENEIEKKYEHIVNFDFRQMLNVLPESFGDPSQKVVETLQSIERQNKQMRWTRSFF